MPLLKKLKLSRKFKKEIESDFDILYSNFKESIDQRSTFFSFEQIDFLFNSEKELIGFIDRKKFKIRLNNKNNFFKLNHYPIIAKGNFINYDNKTVIECTISPFSFSASLYYSNNISSSFYYCINIKYYNSNNR